MSKKYIYCVLLAILCLVLIFGLLFNSSHQKNDAKKFIEEYESLNEKYLKLDLASNNPFIYESFNKVYKYMDTSILTIYIGNAKDDNSRLVVKYLDKLAKTNNVKKIYYLDYENLSDEMLNKIAKKIDVEKINMPTVIFINNGILMDYYIYEDEINEKELKNKFDLAMQKTYNDFCDETCND